MPQKPKKQTKTLEELENTYLDLDTQIELLKGQKEWLKDCIILRFEDRGITKDNGISLVVQERVTLDDLAIKAALSVPQWNKIKRELVDKDKLEAAIKMGEIDEELAEKATKRTEVKFLRIN